ncbi:hypothetical protein FB555_001601 [Alpinimonas psychrophila]|uniref:Uncharacterized protein n=1 Tax=Alpinimonas psychrophila TaxID=748908 RepID=A0A7W3JUT1_9MICO|nr:hypothetical protein [Alpinimonas psychrophila]
MRSPHDKVMEAHFYKAQLNEHPEWLYVRGTGWAEGNLDYLEICLEVCDLLVSQGVTVSGQTSDGFRLMPLPELRDFVLHLLQSLYTMQNLPRNVPKHRFIHGQNFRTMTLNLDEYFHDPELGILVREAWGTVVRARSKNTGGRESDS